MGDVTSILGDAEQRETKGSFPSMLAALLCVTISVQAQQGGGVTQLEFSPDQRGTAGQPSGAGYSGTNAVNVVFDRQDIPNGLVHLSTVADGPTQLTTVDGVFCRKLSRHPNGQWQFFYFQVDPTFKAVGLGPLKVEVEYYDGVVEDSTNFDIQYDASGAQPAFDARFVWANGRTYLGASRQWRTALFRLPDATFLNSENDGADFRLQVWGELAVRRVTLSRDMPNPAEVPVPGVLFGRVTDEAGSPMAGADVRLEQANRAVGGARTDDKGQYRLISIPNGGTYDLSATQNGKVGWQLGLVLKPRDESEVNVILRHHEVEGRVLSLDSKPLSSVVVDAVYYGTDARTVTAPRDAAAALQPGSDKPPAHGLLGRYYIYEPPMVNFPSPAGRQPFLTRVDPRIAFANKGDFGDPRLDTDFGVQWIGKIRITESGDYTFYTKADDGARLTIDGKTVLESERWDIEVFGSARLLAGDHELLLEYYQKGVGADCHLWWKPPGQSKTVVPEDVLYPIMTALPSWNLRSLRLLDRQAISTNSTLTDRRGEFRFAAPKPGWYQIRTHGADGFVYHHDNPDELVDLAPGVPIPAILVRMAPPRKGNWRQFTAADGLAADGFLSSALDSEGAIWLGTLDGASRFNGREFQSLTREEGLSHDHVHSILAEPNGAILFGTDRGVSFYDGKGFHPLSYQPQLVAEEIMHLTRDARGDLWFASYFHGLFHYDGVKLRQFSLRDGLPATMVHCVAQGPAGEAWAATSQGLARFNRTNFVEVSALPSLAHVPVSYLICEPSGAVWIGTPESGLWWTDGTNSHRFGTADGLFNDKIWSLHRDGRGILWVGGVNHLSRYNGTTWVHFPAEEVFPAKATFVSIISDRQGTLWAATSDHGVWRHDETSFVNFSAADGLPGSFVNACLTTSDGAVWFGGELGASRYHLGRFTTPPAANNLGGSGVLSLAESTRGELWMGSSIWGPSEFGPISWFLGTNLVRKDSGEWPRSGAVGSISPGRDGTVWLILSGREVLHLDGQHKVAQFDADELHVTRALLCVHCDASGRAWIGTEGDGLIRIQGGHGTRFTMKEGLSDDHVNALCSDPDGTLWIGTGNGICRYDGTNFTHFSRAGGWVGGNWTECAFRDSKGAHWFGTDRGVTRLAKGIWISFDQRDGMAGGRVRGVCEDGEGNMWFGTDQGVTRYRSSKETPSRPKITVDAEQIRSTGSNTFQVTTGRRVTFRFSSIDTRTRPDNQRYSHRLTVLGRGESAGEGWSQASRQTEFTHTFHKRGSYSFAVRYLDQDLNLSEPSQVTIQSEPPWYGNAFIVGPAVGGVAGLLVWAFVARSLYVRKRREAERWRDELLRHEQQARVALESKNNELAESNRQLAAAKEAADEATKAKSQFLANVSHELRTPLNAIIGYAEMIQEEAPDLGASVLVPDVQKIHAAARHQLGLINDILDLAKIEAGRMSILNEEFGISGLINEVVATVQPLVMRNSNQLVLHCPPDAGLMLADQTKLRQVLFNLLSNACKFTERGTISLDVNPYLQEPQSLVQFQVRDTGIGMTREQLCRIFNAFTQAEAATSRKYGGTGLGLALSRKFCLAMGGELTVESEFGKGSVFTIRLPRTAPTSE